MKKIAFTICCSILMAWLLPVAYAATFECADVTGDRSNLFVIMEEAISFQQDDNSRICYRVCICEIKNDCTGVDPAKQTCQRVQVLKGKTGVDLIYNYVGMIYKWAAGTIGIITVFTMVYNGILIMSAGGDSAKIEQAKGRITQSLVGLVILFLSGLILYTINPTFFV
jgi:hypothetical protein